MKEAGMTDADLEYLRCCLLKAPLTPLVWDGEDRNIAAFRSRESLIDWYCQPPGKDGESYRDRAFYSRELAHLSRLVEPRTVVEFGTSLGIGTCLLRWLNPNARLVTVDISSKTIMPGTDFVTMGYLARHQGIECDYVLGRSWEYQDIGVDLCFVDADHSYDAVTLDSQCAWDNRSRYHRWAIVWHDHNSRHPGVLKAVAEFCDINCLTLQSRLDSDTVWVAG